MDTERNKQIKVDKSDSPGRVTIDSRGRNVWQWNDGQLDSTTIMLQRLDNSALSLEPTRSVRRPKLERTAGDSRYEANPGSGSRTRAGSRSSAEPRSRSASRSEATAQSGVYPETGAFELEQTFTVKLGGGFDPYNRS